MKSLLLITVMSIGIIAEASSGAGVSHAANNEVPPTDKETGTWVKPLIIAGAVALVATGSLGRVAISIAPF